MIKFILCVLLGILGHQTSPIFDAMEDRLNGRGLAWPRIGRYAVGGIMIWIANRVMLRHAEFEKNAAVNVDIIDGAIAKGLIGVGSGVAAGYVLDMVKDHG